MIEVLKSIYVTRVITYLSTQTTPQKISTITDETRLQPKVIRKIIDFLRSLDAIEITKNSDGYRPFKVYKLKDEFLKKYTPEENNKFQAELDDLRKRWRESKKSRIRTPKKSKINFGKWFIKGYKPRVYKPKAIPFNEKLLQELREGSKEFNKRFDESKFKQLKENKKQ